MQITPKICVKLYHLRMFEGGWIIEDNTSVITPFYQERSREPLPVQRC